MSAFSFLSLLFTTQFMIWIPTTVYPSPIQCNYYSDGGQYVPTDVCWNYGTASQSARFSCYNNQLYLTRFFRLNCVGTAYFNQTYSYDETTGQSMNCSFNKICNYIEITLYDDIVNCNHIQFETSSTETQVVINECVYAPSHGIYRLDTCTDSMWSISVYATSDCKVSSLLTTLIASYPTCSVGDAYQYQTVTQCTEPLNTIQCGYIQIHQNEPLIPLNVCVSSYSYVCIHDLPFLYVMDCHNTSIVHQNISITPFSYSCSPTLCNYASIQSGTEIHSVVTDECFNHFDDDLKMVSSHYTCDEYLSEYVYDAPNCIATDSTIRVVRHSNGSNINCVTLSPTSHPTSHPALSPNKNIDLSTLYVTAYGVDVEGCGPLSNPCGSFGGILPRLKVSQMQSVEIIVRGQNFNQLSSGFDCLFQITEYKFFENSASTQIIITFDEAYSSTLSDWYDIDRCSIAFDSQTESAFIHTTSFWDGVDRTLTVNHFILDNYLFDQLYQPSNIMIIGLGTTLVCNRCSFININITSKHFQPFYAYHLVTAAITGLQLHFYNSTFNHMHWIPMDGYTTEYNFSVTQLRDPYYYRDSEHPFSSFVFRMDGNFVYDIGGFHSFLNIEPTIRNKAIDTLISIHRTIFDAIALNETILFHDQNIRLYSDESVPVDHIHIYDSMFLNILSGGVVFIANDQSSDVILHNMYTSTVQSRNSYVSLFRFIGGGAVVNMDDIFVEYHYNMERCSLYETHNVIPSEYIDPDISYYQFLFYCDIPIQFVYCDGSMDAVNISVSNNVSSEYTESMKSFHLKELNATYNFTTGYDVYIAYEYYHSLYTDISKQFSFIQNEGELSIDSLQVYGAGAHAIMIYNSLPGSAIINNVIAIPETYGEYDGSALQIHSWIMFGEQSSDTYVTSCTSQMILTNSVFFGANYYGISAFGGDIYLYNVTMQRIPRACAIICDYFQLNASVMMDIGKWYDKPSSYIKPSSSNKNHYYLSSITPIIIYAPDIIITNSVFAYLDENGFSMFDDDELLSISRSFRSPTELTNVQLINNTFEINDINVRTAYDPFGVLKEPLGNILYPYIEYLESLFQASAILRIPNAFDVKMINNRFTVNENNVYVTHSEMIEDEIVWVYIDNIDGDVCMSGNEFHDFAIWLKNGVITSCIKPQLVQFINKTECNYGDDTFGVIREDAMNYNQLKPNIFNIQHMESSVVIKNEANTVLILENNIINIDMSIEQNTTEISVFNLSNGDIMWLDTELVVPAAEEYVDIHVIIGPHCTRRCYSILNDNVYWIQILHLMCNPAMTNMNASSAYLNDIFEATSQVHSTPYLLQLSFENDGSYFPGSQIKLNYRILDQYYHYMEGIERNLSVTLESLDEDLFGTFKVSILSHEGYLSCEICDNGVLFTTATLDMIGNSYVISTFVKDHYLLSNPLNITIARCPMGYGATISKQCDVCSAGYYNLLPTTDSCLFCDDSNINGITCPGSHNLLIHYEYWISSHSLLLNQVIITSKCPSGFCCQLETGCDILQNEDVLCAKNRDVSVPLCGQCADGFSEVYGTTDCKVCDQSYPQLLLLPVVYGLLWGLFIVIVSSTSSNHSNHSPQKKVKKKKQKCQCLQKLKCSCFKSNINAQTTNGLSRREYMDVLEVMLFKIMIYYYQSVANLLNTGEIQTAWIGFVNLFNLSIFPVVSAGNSDGICIVSNMTTIQKITLELTTTGSILLLLFMIRCLSLLNINILNCCKRTLNFGTAFSKATLLCIGQMLSVLFQLLACREIGDTGLWVHYFFGSHQCYDAVWIVSVIILCAILVSMCAWFVWIYKARSKDSKSNKTMDKSVDYYPLVWCYKSSYWFWEFVLFIRRLILALVIIVTDVNEFKIALAMVLLIYLFFHHKCEPFRSKYENQFESLLIMAVVTLIFVDVAAVLLINQFKMVILSLLVLFPLIYYLCFMFMNCNSLRNSHNPPPSKHAIQHKYGKKKRSVSMDIECVTLTTTDQEMTEYTEEEEAHDGDNDEKKEDTYTYYGENKGDKALYRMISPGGS